MSKLTLHLWFDTQALEAAEFYTSTFANSEILSTSEIHDTPSGICQIVRFRLMGLDFQAINAGPYFTFNPSISFRVLCQTREKVDALWTTLSESGMAMMPLDSYPFCDYYGWVQDRYGLSWQLMLVPEQPHCIVPSFMFVGDQCGHAEEALELYTSVFKNSRVDAVFRYDEHEDPDRPGTIKNARFTLEGQPFAAMDSAHPHQFSMNEAVSIMVICADQAEIDYYWERLSAVPESEQCGWLKDRFGVSWQVVPEVMNRMLSSGDEEKVARVTRAFLKMKKFDVAKLEAAFQG